MIEYIVNGVKIGLFDVGRTSIRVPWISMG